MINEVNFEKLKNIATEVSDREGCILYHLDIINSPRSRKIMIYIEKEGRLSEDTAEGASLKNCENVSKAVSLLLDVDEIIVGGAYTLEVSTPGLERPLVEKWHYEAALGKEVRIRANKGLRVNEGKTIVKNFQGELLAINEDKVKVNDGKKVWDVSVEDIKKANLVFKIAKQKKRKI